LGTADKKGRTNSRKEIDMQVEMNSLWVLYAATIPESAKALGTVRVDGKKGALVRFEATGEFARVNASAVKRLKKSEVQAAIREMIASEVCGFMRVTENNDDYSLHQRIAEMIRDGKSLEEIQEKENIIAFAYTYEWLKREMEVLS
jgi:hypothetical protein